MKEELQFWRKLCASVTMNLATFLRTGAVNFEKWNTRSLEKCEGGKLVRTYEFMIKFELNTYIHIRNINIIIELDNLRKVF